jgi:choice-of-anchor B domain-containing protein
VYVFKRSGSSWQQVGKLVSPDPKDRSAFGAALGLIGDALFVGEPGFNERTGAVHVFRADASGAFTAAARIAPATAQKSDAFGASMAVQGDRLFVSATGANAQVGLVYGFARDADGEWRESRKLAPFESTRADGFGQSIAVDGANLWIGAPRGFLARGSVYHYATAQGDTLFSDVERIRQEPTGKSPQIQFGSALAARGDVAAIAMIGDDFFAGSVVILERLGSSWKQTAIVKSPDERIASMMGQKVECGSAGKAGIFECKDFDLMAFMSVPDLGGSRGVRLSGNWGWTDPETKKEYALVGRMDALSIVDVTNPEKPVFVAEMAKTKEANPSSWREIKTYRNWALVVSDGAGPHGIQFLDLTRLRTIKQFPARLEPDHTYRRVNSVHDIVVNEEAGMAYAVGSSSGGETCGGGLHMIDLEDPKNPQFLGCFADTGTGRLNTGYTHDAQCVMYKGPDQDYRGREICLSSNETMLSIQDVTDKKAPRVVSRGAYPKVGYTHQGWLDDEQRYFYLDDELDEVSGLTEKTRTIIFDLSDLDDPQVVGEFYGTTAASDHNLYVIGDYVYQSNYLAGLRILDIRDRKNPVEVGYFDTVPYGQNTAGFGGSWNNYPFFKSGNIIVNSGGEGLFIVRKKAPKVVS